MANRIAMLMTHLLQSHRRRLPTVDWHAGKDTPVQPSQPEGNNLRHKRRMPSIEMR